MTEELKKICEVNKIKYWYENNKWYLDGDSGAIARSLRASNARFIKVDGKTYDMDETTKYLNKFFLIKFAYEELIF